MNFFVEITLIGCIICLAFHAFNLKKLTNNANSSKELLKQSLIQKESEFKLRESNLQQTLNNLQSSFEIEQKSIEERKCELKEREEKILKDISELEVRLSEETEAKKKVVSQKKSSEVRLGNIAETLAPFLDQFNFDPEECTFLGMPIDYISFGDEEITFIEVKSGKSQLNKKQRHIRDQVKSKLVAWKEIRIQ